MFLINILPLTHTEYSNLGNRGKKYLKFTLCFEPVTVMNWGFALNSEHSKVFHVNHLLHLTPFF